MKCLACKKDMFIMGNHFSSAKDSEEVFVQLKYACTNPGCTEFAGNDLRKPKEEKIKKTNKSKVN